MVNIDVRKPQWGDSLELVVKMRQADLEELAALGYTSGLDHLIDTSVNASAPAYTITADGDVACIMGVVPLVDGAAIWMLGTDLVTVHQRALMRLCRPYIQAFLSEYKHLYNYVHADNTRAVRWLKSVGFTLQSPEPYGPLGSPFHRFDMRS